MSRRDLAHLLTALGNLSSEDPAVAVPVTALDAVIGRARGDMRTPLNLQSLRDEGLVMPHPDGSWSLTPHGIAWLKQDRELSDR
jgi:hypothetical protein